MEKSKIPEAFTEMFPITVSIDDMRDLFPDGTYSRKPEYQATISQWFGITREIWGEDLHQNKFVIMQILSVTWFEEAIGYEINGPEVKLPSEDLVFNGFSEE